MKKNTLLMALAIAAALTASGCKSQKTLSQAAAVADPVDEVQEVQPITYAQPQREKPVVKPGDKSEAVTAVNAADAALLRDYNVVVGSFTSKANAEAYKITMQQRGYSAYVVTNAEGWYRVIAASYDTRDEAEPVRDRIRAAYPAESCGQAWLLIPKR